jgi:hypothetical protein
MFMSDCHHGNTGCSECLEQVAELEEQITKLNGQLADLRASLVVEKKWRKDSDTRAEEQAERVRQLEKAIVDVGNEWYHGGLNTMPAAISAAIDLLQARQAYVDVPLTSENLADVANAVNARTAQARSYVDVLEELVGLMEGVIAGDYKPDSFTLQPAYEALGWKRIEGDDCSDCEGSGFINHTRCHCGLRAVSTQATQEHWHSQECWDGGGCTETRTIRHGAGANHCGLLGCERCADAANKESSNGDKV